MAFNVWEKCQGERDRDGKMAPGQFVAAGTLPVIDSFFSGRFVMCVF